MDFYEILRRIAENCAAKEIVGMNSGNLTSLIYPYYAGCLDPSTDPWSLLSQTIYHKSSSLCLELNTVWAASTFFLIMSRIKLPPARWWNALLRF